MLVDDDVVVVWWMDGCKKGKWMSGGRGPFVTGNGASGSS